MVNTVKALSYGNQKKKIKLNRAHVILSPYFCLVTIGGQKCLTQLLIDKRLDKKAVRMDALHTFSAVLFHFHLHYLVLVHNS